ncbi:MAG: PD-(D/E)XK motif protein [Bacteroidales bacterium]|nr:PD-(D/E)XK motif protein [Bacteroidales bacterium]
MSTLDELQLFFASLTNGAAPLQSLPKEYPAYAIRTLDGYGVAIEWDSNRPVSEYFSSAHLVSHKTVIGGFAKTLLMLVSSREEFRNEFATVCAQFIDPGKDGKERTSLLQDPIEWWQKWKTLLGNASLDKTPYSVLCEMLALKHILSFDASAAWTASQSGTHDIESETRSYEVKSTIRRYGALLSISSQFQLLTPKPLDLYFVRVEESPTGISINDVASDLKSLGYDEGLLESQLSKAHYDKGSSYRDKKYSILEKRVYPVNDSFPRITAQSFKGDVIPKGVVEINYTVDLDGVPYGNW